MLQRPHLIKSLLTAVPVWLALLVIVGCTAPPANTGRVETFAPVATQDTRLGRVLAPLEREHQGESGFVLLDSGLDALSARAALMRNADLTLDLQYFIFKNDQVGRYIILGLLNAADRGVRVRVLIDDYHTSGNDAGMLAIDSHPNIEVRLYNPFHRWMPRFVQMITGIGRIDRRMHNKVFAADNQAAVIGGRNIGDEYFNADPAFVYKDIDVLTIGPAVAKISSAFDLYWNHSLSYPVSTIIRERVGAESLSELRKKLQQFVEDNQESQYAQALRESVFSETSQARELDPTWGTSEIIYDLPSKTLESKSDREVTLAPKLRPYINRLKSEIIMLSPYFVPSKEGMVFFNELQERGVQVRILTNSLASTDVPIVYSGYSKYRKSLLKAGVQLYEHHPALEPAYYEWRHDDADATKTSLHAKMFIFDREYLFIGSMNLDPRSFYTNTEIGVVLHAPELARFLAERFDSHSKDRAYTLELAKGWLGQTRLRWVIQQKNDDEQVWFKEPETGLLKRLGIFFLRFIPIESHL
jgi:cardiolipin synthase C